MPTHFAAMVYSLLTKWVEFGLGKTIQALGTINAKRDIKTVLIICPASLRLNWEREARKWLVRPFIYHVVADNDPIPPEATCVIVNYDRLKDKVQTLLMARYWDILIADECHYAKAGTSRRAKALLGSWDKSKKVVIQGLIHRAKYRVFLTGTPILNRPIEIQPIAAALDPSQFGNRFKFAQRYCDAHQTKWGWDLTGASHLDELQEKLRASVMVRRRKADVLTELPPKRRQVVPLPPNGVHGIVQAENNAWQAWEERIEEAQNMVDLAHASGNKEAYEAAVMALRDMAQAAFTEISKLRHETAVAKVPMVVEHCDDLLESVEKLVIFAHHRDVIAALAEHFGDRAVVITGDTSLQKRQENVDRFQADPRVTVFIGNIQAAGVGITLTAASTVVFAELDWTPAAVSQAEDRTHRIGQTSSVLVQHLVLDGSLDARMAQTLIAKQSIADKALDDKPIAQEPALPTREPRPRKYPIASPEERERVSLALRTLAGMCDGALQRDNVGFNNADTRVGHELATVPADQMTDGQVWLGGKIVRKYHRQIGTELAGIEVA